MIYCKTLKKINSKSYLSEISAILFSFFILILISCGSSKYHNARKQSTSEFTKYVNYNYDNISKSEFENKIKNKQAFEIPSNRKNTKRLVERTQYGIIQQQEAFYKKLKASLDREIKLKDYLIVNYYPGKDNCNTTGTKYVKDSVYYEKRRKRRLAENNILKNIAPNFKRFLIYQKDAEKPDDQKSFAYDPEGLFEKMFFRHHYPCYSIVVIAPDGKYASYFGEHGSRTKYLLLKTLIKNENNPKWSN